MSTRTAPKSTTWRDERKNQSANRYNFPRAQDKHTDYASSCCDEYLDFGSVHLQNKFLQIYLRCEIESSKYSSVATQILPNIGFWTEKTLSRTAVLFIRHRIPISYARLFIRRSITHAYIQHSFYFIYLFFLFKNILQR
jgi:hypothetical protein